MDSSWQSNLLVRAFSELYFQNTHRKRLRYDITTSTLRHFSPEVLGTETESPDFEFFHFLFEGGFVWVDCNSSRGVLRYDYRTGIWNGRARLSTMRLHWNMTGIQISRLYASGRSITSIPGATLLHCVVCGLAC